MTKREMFNEIINLANTVEREDIVDFARHEIELLDKRNSKETKAAKAKAEEREALKVKALEVIGNAGAPMRTMNIAAALEISPQKATPILKALAESGELKVDKVKGATVYSLPTLEE